MMWVSGRHDDVRRSLGNLVRELRDGGRTRMRRCDDECEGFQKSPKDNLLSSSLGLDSFILGIILIYDRNVIH